MEKRFCILLVAGMNGFGTYAQGMGEIQGKVLEDGQPAMEAMVEAVQGERRVAAMCDEGRFTLKPLIAGTYTVTVSAVGMSSVVFEGVEVFADNITYTKDAQLRPTELGGVTLQVERWYEPMIKHDNTGVTRISSRAIQNSPMAKDPVAIVAVMTPGVYRSPNGDGLFFRGSRSENTCYFVDGMKLGPALTGLPNKAIGSLSVYTGGVPAKYGDITGGVIAIETKSYFDLYQERNLGNH